MAVNISEALTMMRKAGPTKVRAVPMPGQNVNTGNYKIEIDQGFGTWVCVIEGLPKVTAEGLIGQATNRVIME